MLEMYTSYPNGYNHPLPPLPFAPPPPSPSRYSEPPSLSLQYGPPAPSESSGERIYFRNVIAPRIAPTHKTGWSTGLFGCFAVHHDPCILTAVCPCIVAGQTAEIVNEGKTSSVEGTLLCLILNPFCCCTCIYTCHTRSKMRQRYMLKAMNPSDFMTHFNCMYCALCQRIPRTLSSVI